VHVRAIGSQDRSLGWIRQLADADPQGIPIRVDRGVDGEGQRREQPVAPRPEQTLGLGLVDADDEWVVASAVLAPSDLLVSGDQGLLAYSAPPLPLRSPRQCWMQLRGNR